MLVRFDHAARAIASTNDGICELTIPRAARAFAVARFGFWIPRAISNSLFRLVKRTDDCDATTAAAKHNNAANFRSETERDSTIRFSSKLDYNRVAMATKHRKSLDRG